MSECAAEESGEVGPGLDAAVQCVSCTLSGGETVHIRG